eukprot:m.22832 g.22832  ORF g.22832 m.22832 type:complete len:67 (+) comp12809_c0_seq3:249-449(+)
MGYFGLCLTAALPVPLSTPPLLGVSMGLGHNGGHAVEGQCSKARGAVANVRSAMNDGRVCALGSIP